MERNSLRTSRVVRDDLRQTKQSRADLQAGALRRNLRYLVENKREVTLIESLDHPPLGVGEASLGPTGAAVANAVARALDLRIRDLPITRASIIAASTDQRIS